MHNGGLGCLDLAGDTLDHGRTLPSLPRSYAVACHAGTLLLRRTTIHRRFCLQKLLTAKQTADALQLNV